MKFQAIQVSPCHTHHTHPHTHTYTHTFSLFLPVCLCFGCFLGAVVSERDGDGCLSPLCHPLSATLKGLPAQGSLLLLRASCCSVTLHLWLQGPFIIIQWLSHDNQWILHELLLIIIWLRPSPPALPARLSRGIALGLWLKPHDSFPFFFSGKYLYKYVYKYIYPSRQPRKIQSTLQTKRNWLKMSTYCLSGPNFWNSRCLHLRFLFQIWISERPVLKH